MYIITTQSDNYNKRMSGMFFFIVAGGRSLCLALDNVLVTTRQKIEQWNKHLFSFITFMTKVKIKNLKNDCHWCFHLWFLALVLVLWTVPNVGVDTIHRSSWYKADMLQDIKASSPPCTQIEEWTSESLAAFERRLQDPPLHQALEKKTKIKPSIRCELKSTLRLGGICTSMRICFL